MDKVLNGQICGWARHYLTGDRNGTRPTDTQLTFYVEDEARKLTTSRPTLVLAGPNALAGQDLDLFAQAVGAMVAKAVAPTDIALTLIDRRSLVAREIRIGPVTHKIAASPGIVPPAKRVDEYQDAADAALAQISVLRVHRTPPDLFAVTGRRRNQRGW